MLSYRFLNSFNLNFNIFYNKCKEKLNIIGFSFSIYLSQGLCIACLLKLIKQYISFSENKNILPSCFQKLYYLILSTG